MKLHIAVHRSNPAGGYWAEVPSLHGCFTQADTLAELKINIIEALTSYLELSSEEIKKNKMLSVVGDGC